MKNFLNEKSFCGDKICLCIVEFFCDSTGGKFLNGLENVEHRQIFLHDFSALLFKLFIYILYILKYKICNVFWTLVMFSIDVESLYIDKGFTVERTR